ncbi:Large ribosomal subunit protein [Trichinella pseudospiralis]
MQVSGDLPSMRPIFQASLGCHRGALISHKWSKASTRLFRPRFRTCIFFASATSIIMDSFQITLPHPINRSNETPGQNVGDEILVAFS